MIPVLHLETHGCRDGLDDGREGAELLTWGELIGPLQALNFATRCNVIVFVAACKGYAGISALTQGPRAPAVALVGPDADVMPRELLDGTKEFYRRWMDENPNLHDVAASASQQAGAVWFEAESFTLFAYEALMSHLLVSMRPAEQRQRYERIRQLLLTQNDFSPEEVECRLNQWSGMVPATDWQRIWDEMFMIDVYPENRTRFGLDMSEVTRLIAERAK